MEIQKLISIISAGLIVPVIGSDFCKVKVSPDRVDPSGKLRLSLSVFKNIAQTHEVILTLNQYLAIRMADKFGLTTLTDEELSLNTVFLNPDFTQDTKYQMLHDEYRLLDAEKQLEDYIKLASINKFKFYINTGPDNFLLDAFKKLNDRQPKFIASQLLESNNNNTLIDDPSEFSPVVFNIFGSIMDGSNGNNCAITDENYIELIVKLQEESNKQNSCFYTLFNFFRPTNLLIIGSSFPDWLMRFLIRLISSRRYTQSNQKLISDTQTLGKTEFANFLKQYNGQVITQQGVPFASAGDFVNALYQNVYGPKPVAAPRYKEKVFISFISDDRNIAQMLNKAFKEKGVDTFFDGDEVFAGTNFENVIKPALQACDYFLPVITTNSITDPINVKRYVYKEWMLANFRKVTKEDTGEEATFIKPYSFGSGNINMEVYKIYFEGIGMEKVTDVTEDGFRTFAENFISRNNLTPVKS